PGPLPITPPPDPAPQQTTGEPGKPRPPQPPPPIPKRQGRLRRNPPGQRSQEQRRSPGQSPPTPHRTRSQRAGRRTPEDQLLSSLSQQRTHFPLARYAGRGPG